MILQMEIHLQHCMGLLEEKNSGFDKNAGGMHFVTCSYNSVNLKCACHNCRLNTLPASQNPKPTTHKLSVDKMNESIYQTQG